MDSVPAHSKEVPMKPFTAAISFGILIVGTSAPLHAGTLFTPPLPGGGAGVYCQAVNVTTSPRDVTVAISDADGTALTATCAALGTMKSCTLAVPGFGTAPHACRIDVAGGKSTVRGSLVRLTSDGVPAVAVPAQ
jgi:hypothetical protein